MCMPELLAVQFVAEKNTVLQTYCQVYQEVAEDACVSTCVQSRVDAPLFDARLHAIDIR